MAKNEVKETEELSKSRQKRAERQKEVARAKKQKAASKIISIVIAIAVVAVIVVAAGLNIYKSATRTKSSEDYSKGLTDEGKIDGVNPLDYITLADYKNLVIPKAEISATDEEIENDREKFSNQIKQILDEKEIKYHTIGGNYFERLIAAKEIIKDELGITTAFNTTYAKEEANDETEENTILEAI